MDNIDKQIAEKVMGWTVIEIVNDGYYIDRHNGTGRCTQDSFMPSTDIAGAWLVVEKMQELGYWWEAHSPDDAFFIMFYDSSDKDNGEATADTMPMAICLAALEAVNGYRYRRSGGVNN